MADLTKTCPHCGGNIETELNCSVCKVLFGNSKTFRLDEWLRRTPPPTTQTVLEKIAATAEVFKTERRGSGFGANISFTLDEMRDLLAEWPEPAPPPAPEQPTPSSPWTCCICGGRVRIGDDLRPYHLATGYDHDAELSDEDKD